MLELFNQALALVNGVIWHQYVIFGLLLIGILFTVWTRFTQFRSLTHGFAVVMGRYDKHDDPGSISHFQALSAALSATVGVGNIGGTAIAISMGGPGALFWMWIVGLLGMALKTMEVTVSMIYRSSEGGLMKGGPMWVVERGLKDKSAWLQPFGKLIGVMFCVTLLIATFTGGLFFQAWNASNVTEQFFGIPASVVGLILAVIVGLVILGGIERIGMVASRIVPFMCGVYLLAGIYVISLNVGQVPSMFAMIFQSAFSPSDAQGAFVGGTVGAVFARGMQQAFFSNEAGQGSSPIVHSAVKTDEPVREGIVAGLEPFIDTIVVCTLTGLVILLSGVWNREADFQQASLPAIELVDSQWQIADSEPPKRDDREWNAGEQVFCLVCVPGSTEQESTLQQVAGTVFKQGESLAIEWQGLRSEFKPELKDAGVYELYAGASLTALAFDVAQPGLGRWLVTLATWLFGISTMISWSYYGEQGVRFLFGDRGVFPYRILFCLGIVVSCLGVVQSQTELTHLANMGTGVMLWVNIPITLLFASDAIRHYNDYFRRVKAGEFKTNQESDSQ
ncbi:MAG: AGCS family alanine or glycine:cation symporter [Mariniblastus sp.]|jgi:AGCS family alanine or glycine:cation symporter